nr:FUN14 domain-containing protein 2 isoform X4 [Kogia breviceps]
MVCLLALVLEGPYVENRLQGAKWRPGNQRRSSNSDGAESQSLVPSGHSGLTRGHGFAHFTRSSQGCPLPAAISLSYRRPESLLYPFLCSSILHSVAESSCKHTAWELKGFAQDHEMKCTGFIFQKVGRLAATALGGGFFLLQVANHTGYIKVDWQRVEKDVKKAKEQLKIRNSNQIPTEVKSKAEEVVSFVKKNVLVTGGFFGGFLLGMAS